jgi:hypothetical protein
VPESRLQRQAQVYGEGRGAYALNQWGTALSGSGVPDNIWCYRGRFIAFEFKHQGKDLHVIPTIDDDRFVERAQAMHLRRVRKAGGIAYAVNTLGAVMWILNLIDREIDRAK